MDGDNDSFKLGAYVGNVEGDDDTFGLGAYVGMYEGIKLGVLEVLVGPVDGTKDGPSLGKGEGESDHEIDGRSLGKIEENSEGLMDG